jgi:hypothetical protein
VFNDVHYANLLGDIDKTVSLPDGSPEQAVMYMTLGKHLDRPIYGAWNGMDVVHWVRDPGNPLRPFFRWHPQLEYDWDVKAEDGFSNADHYRGFAAGPVASARTLFQESAPEHVEALNALLARHAGVDPESLDWDAQVALLHRALVEDSEGRRMIQDLTSRRSIGVMARGYRTLTEVAGIPGLALRWMQRNCLWLLGGFGLFRVSLRALRQRKRNPRDKQTRIMRSFLPIEVHVRESSAHQAQVPDNRWPRVGAAGEELAIAAERDAADFHRAGAERRDRGPGPGIPKHDVPLTRA